MGGGGAFFDYDADGDPDIYAVNGAFITADPPAKHPVNALFRNDAGHFSTVEAGVAHPGVGMGVAAADYDLDGDLDLYLTNYGPNVLYRNDGGLFTDIGAATGVDDPRWGTSCAFADYDLDGDLDLYVANYVSYDPQAANADQIPYTAGNASYAGQAPPSYP
ncbi:MAG TPA: CRTAC1 family protein, partial [Paracoccus sp.]|nr:CRTAC1 family protein [Paracoccus sp. (in: a-proteobacteria)]